MLRLYYTMPLAMELLPNNNRVDNAYIYVGPTISGNNYWSIELTDRVIITNDKNGIFYDD